MPSPTVMPCRVAYGHTIHDSDIAWFAPGPLLARPVPVSPCPLPDLLAVCHYAICRYERNLRPVLNASPAAQYLDAG